MDDEIASAGPRALPQAYDRCGRRSLALDGSWTNRVSDELGFRALLADMLRVSNLVQPQIGNRLAAELGTSLAELDQLAGLKHSSLGRLRMSEIR